MWDASQVDGPFAIPILGEPNEDGARDVLGYIEGYHLNVAPQCVSPEVEAFRVEPSSPERVFAGAQTVFLRFDNEVEARTKLAAYWQDET